MESVAQRPRHARVVDVPAWPPTVLAVDDDVCDLELLTEAFRHCSIPAVDLRGLRSFEEMREYLLHGAQGAGPALLLLDLHMPRVDGLGALRWLRSQTAPWRRVPVVVMTTSHDYVEIRRAYDEGANSFLVKPMGFEELRRDVEDVARYWLGRNRWA